MCGDEIGLHQLSTASRLSCSWKDQEVGELQLNFYQLRPELSNFFRFHVKPAESILMADDGGGL